MVSTAVKGAKVFLSELFEKICRTRAVKTRAARSTNGIEIGVSIVATRNVSRWG